MRIYVNLKISVRAGVQIISVENGSGRRWVEYIRRHKSWLTASSSSSSQFVFAYRTLVRSSTSCRRRPGARQAIDGGAARPSRSAAPDGGVDRPACSVAPATVVLPGPRVSAARPRALPPPGRRAYPTRATPLFSCAESTTNGPYLL